MPTAELGRGLAAGAVAVLVVALGARLAHRRGRTAPAVGTGIAVVVAALWAISRTRSVPIDVLVALGGVGAAGALARARGRGGRLVAGALAVPFAAVLAVDASSTAWIRGAVVVTAALGGLAAATTDRRSGWSELTPVLYAVTVAGAFAAVPDTEEVAALLGAAAPMALLGWPFGRARLGGAGAASATALLVWVVAIGGQGRSASIVGGLTCLGLLAAVPVGGWLRARRGEASTRQPRSQLGAVAIHGAAVLVASRGAGISREMPVAVGLGLVSATLALGGAVALSGGTRTGGSPT